MLTHTLSQRSDTSQRLARVLRHLVTKRARVCSWCSVVHEHSRTQLAVGTLCLLHEPEGSSQGICHDCFNLWLSDPDALGAWMELRIAHIARIRVAERMSATDAN